MAEPTVNRIAIRALPAGVRSLQTSVSQGLRRGPNLLQVRVRKSSGGWAKTTVRFKLITHRPLAGAGADRRVVVGEAVHLTGADLGHVFGAAHRSASAAAAGLHWTVAGRPRNSPLPALSNADTTTPTFTPEVPGPYTFRLGVRGPHGTTSDTVTVDAVLRNPLVPVQTEDQQRGIPGIKVGDQFYPEDTNAGGFSGFPYWQVLVLDRKTLGLVSNTTYDCQPPTPCGSRNGRADALASDVGRLDDTKLVIAALHPVQRLVGTDSLFQFKSIGAPDLKGSFVHFGFASLIGVPGLPQGHAYSRLITGDHEAGNSGDMIGYLTPDQYFHYTFLPKGRVKFDTRVPGAGVDNAMQVGATLYTTKLAAVGGYHVVVLDPYSLALRDGGFFQTSSTDAGAATAADNEMTSFLRTKTRPGDVVLLASVNHPGEVPLNGGADRTALRGLASAVASVGGTMDLFNRSGIKAGTKYSLVGWGGAGEGKGQETSTIKDPAPADGRLRGVLVPDSASLFKPTVSSAFDEPPEALADLLVESPSKWPLDGDAGAQKAITYIGSKENRLGADPRASYWLQPYEQSDWVSLASVVRQLSYPGDGRGFTRAEFDDAQRELVQEMIWVGNVRAYLKNLAAPFAKEVLTSWSNLTVITDKINEALKPPNDHTQMLVLHVMTGLLNISGLIATKALEVTAVTYETGLHFLAREPGGDSESSITAGAHELADDLITRLQHAQNSFQGVGNIVVGDYEKLKTVGTLGGCSASAADCPAEWQFSQEDQAKAATAVYKSVEAEYDQSIMKLAFPAYVLDPRGNHRSYPDNQVSNNARSYRCRFNTDQFIAPFRDESDAGQVTLLQELPDQYDVLALANLSDLGVFNHAPLVPSEAALGVLKRMFGPLGSSLDPKAGGLGIYKPDFMRSASKGDYNTAQKKDHCGVSPWPG